MIPDSWYQYNSFDVDIKTKQSAIKQGLDAWYNWEKDTYHLYQELYFELIELHLVNDAEVVKKLVKDVKKELDNVSQYKLNKFSMNYDMTSIVEEQEK